LDAGRPQSGILPRQLDLWKKKANKCGKKQYNAAVKDWNAGRLLGHRFPFSPLTEGLLKSLPTVQLLVGDVLVHSHQLPGIGDLAGDAAWLFCLDVGPRGPQLRLGENTAIGADELAGTIDDPEKACAERAMPPTQWVCTTEGKKSSLKRSSDGRQLKTRTAEAANAYYGSSYNLQTSGVGPELRVFGCNPVGLRFAFDAVD